MNGYQRVPVGNLSSFLSAPNSLHPPSRILKEAVWKSEPYPAPGLWEILHPRDAAGERPFRGGVANGWDSSMHSRCEARRQRLEGRKGSPRNPPSQTWALLLAFPSCSGPVDGPQTLTGRSSCRWDPSGCTAQSVPFPQRGLLPRASIEVPASLPLRDPPTLEPRSKIETLPICFLAIPQSSPRLSAPLQGPGHCRRAPVHR